MSETGGTGSSPLEPNYRWSEELGGSGEDWWLPYSFSRDCQRIVKLVTPIRKPLLSQDIST